MKYKYWQVLLIEWRKRGRNGFTIPFIIGSQQYLEDVLNFQDTEELIVDIANNNDIDVYITYCQDINDLILGVRDESRKNIAGKFLKLSDGTDSSLYLTKIANDLGETIEEVVESLHDKYQCLIDAEEFSINNRERGPFSLTERNFIVECFEMIK